MARRELPPAALVVAAAVAAALPDGDVVVGCSGGADSLALALGAAWAARRAGTRADILVIDHGLQPGSADVADGVVARLAAAGVPARAQRVEVRPGADGVEAAARDERLAALAEPGLPVLLGHTLDDQAETVLLGLARGSGPRSLAGMPARRGRLVRPLLGLPRRLTSQACAELGLSPWQDPMNEDPHYARVRVRGRVLPLLERELGPGIAEALARTAGLCRDAADALDAAAAPLAGEPEPDAEALAAAPAGVRRAALAAWLLGRGAPEATTAHVAAVEALVLRWHGQRGVDVPGGTVVREDGHLAYVPR